MHIVRSSPEATLRAIFADLEKLIGQAEVAEELLLAFMLEQAKLEAQEQLIGLTDRVGSTHDR